MKVTEDELRALVDIQKALKNADEYFLARDTMNARMHVSGVIRRPLGEQVEMARFIFDGLVRNAKVEK